MNKLIFKNQLPIAFHPTTILVVDDDDSLLKTLSFFLCTERKILPFNNTSTAFTYLQQYKNSASPSPTTNLEDLIIYLNQDTRFRQIAIIMSDYYMPIENGVSFFRRRVCRDARERFTPSLVQIDSHCATAN